MVLGRGSSSTLLMVGSELLITLMLLESHTKASWKFSLEALSTIPLPFLVYFLRVWVSAPLPMPMGKKLIFLLASASCSRCWAS